MRRRYPVAQPKARCFARLLEKNNTAPARCNLRRFHKAGGKRTKPTLPVKPRTEHKENGSATAQTQKPARPRGQPLELRRSGTTMASGRDRIRYSSVRPTRARRPAA